MCAVRTLPATDEAIDEAAALIRSGGLVAFPTETVYGLGADAANPDAVAKVFAAKGRPSDHPLIVHLADGSQLDEWASEVPPLARRLAEACWPGPLTLVLPRTPKVPDTVTGGRDTVAVRVPDQPVALALLRRSGRGIAAPSANRFGRVSPTTAADVVADLGDGPSGELVELVLDGGPCRVGVESTIVEVVGDLVTVLRTGGTPIERLEELVGAVERTASGPVRAPGMLAVHYAPSARVIPVEDPAAVAGVVADEQGRGNRVAVLAPAGSTGVLPEGTVVLDPVGDATDYARCLYRRLRSADEHGADVVVALLPPAEGLGVAVRDRLARAAAGR
jgi:L-threonylcarbamoyladenylate synthase